MSRSARRRSGRCHSNFAAQGFRGAFVQFGPLQRTAKRLFSIQVSGTVRAGFQMLLKSGHARRVEFAIEVGLQIGFGLLTRHGEPPSLWFWSAPFAVAGEREPDRTLPCQSAAR